jgi:RHS repeat-associated protein
MKEKQTFNSSRIGNLNREMDVLNTSISLDGTHVLGRKFYEFTNHLGNVLTVFSDLKIPQDTDNNNLVDNYLVGIVRSVDYSPFGVELDGRTINYTPPTVSNGTPTVIYQHKFDDSPNAHPYTGTPSNLDPNLTQVNWTNSRNAWTNYAGHTGRAIAINSASADTTKLFLNLTVNEGYLLDVTSYSFYHRSSQTGYTNYNLYVNNTLIGSGAIWVTSGTSLQHTGNVNVSNAIAGLSGNITVRFDLFGGSNGSNGTFRMDDFVLNGFTTAMEEWRPMGYRYGFNGMEKDDEFKGEGNSYTTEFRQYDARVGRWLSLDPVIHHQFSPYIAFDNNPLSIIDPKGSDGEDPSSTGKKSGNLILVISTDTKSDEVINGQNSSNEENSNWDFIYAKTIEEAREKVVEYLKSSNLKELNNLIFHQHGTYGGVVVNKDNSKDEFSRPGISNISINTYFLDKYCNSSLNSLNSYGRGISNFLDIMNKVKKNGNIIFATCFLGSANSFSPTGEFGTTLSRLIKKKSNIYINIGTTITPSGTLLETTLMYKDSPGWLKIQSGGGEPIELPTGIIIDRETGEVKKGDPTIIKK